MGMVAQARLVYGYNLGGDADGWQVDEAAEYGGLRTSWFNSDEDDADFIYDAERELRATALPPLPHDATQEERAEHRKRADEKLGVEFSWHGHHDFLQTLLIARDTEYRVIWGQTAIITPQMLLAVTDAWDRKLERALHMLGLTPTQERPQWLLCASYG